MRRPGAIHQSIDKSSEVADRVTAIDERAKAIFGLEASPIAVLWALGLSAVGTAITWLFGWAASVTSWLEPYGLYGWLLAGMIASALLTITVLLPLAWVAGKVRDLWTRGSGRPNLENEADLSSDHANKMSDFEHDIKYNMQHQEDKISKLEAGLIKLHTTVSAWIERPPQIPHADKQILDKLKVEVEKINLLATNLADSIERIGEKLPRLEGLVIRAEQRKRLAMLTEEFKVVGKQIKAGEKEECVNARHNLAGIAAQIEFLLGVTGIRKDMEAVQNIIIDDVRSAGIPRDDAEWSILEREHDVLGRWIVKLERESNAQDDYELETFLNH